VLRLALAWTAVWLALDLAGGGLIRSGFDTGGLQQAWMFVLLVVPWLGVGVAAAVVALLRARRRIQEERELGAPS
jgi:hypothetical protein